MFEVGDVVMVHSEIQSKKEKKIVAILLYQTRRPYVIISKASVGTYNCRKYGKPNGSIKRFHMEDLYLLPPTIYPTEPVDTADLRYLNSDFAPLHHPFSKTFDIEAYNNRWFDTESKLVLKKLLCVPIETMDDRDVEVIHPKDYTPTSTLPLPHTKCPAPSDERLDVVIIIPTETVYTEDLSSDSIAPSRVTLYTRILQSTDKLFVCVLHAC